MLTTRLQRPALVRVESATTVPGTRIYIDGKDVTNDVVTVNWTVDANDRRPPTATVTFIQADLSGEAELAEQAPADSTEFRALDLTVLDIKPGDKILIRSHERIDDEDCDFIKANVVRQFPGHEVLILDGGLELSVLRDASPRRTPDQWCAHYGVEVLHSSDDPRRVLSRAEEPMTLPEFWWHALGSSIERANVDAWERIYRDAHASEGA